jgi:hypothetical protein
VGGRSPPRRGRDALFVSQLALERGRARVRPRWLAVGLVAAPVLALLGYAAFAAVPPEIGIYLPPTLACIAVFLLFALALKRQVTETLPERSGSSTSDSPSRIP